MSIPEILRAWVLSLPRYGTALRGPFTLRTASGPVTFATNGAATLAVLTDAGAAPPPKGTVDGIDVALFGGEAALFSARFAPAGEIGREQLVHAAQAHAASQPGTYPRGYVAGVLVCLETVFRTLVSMQRADAEFPHWAAPDLMVSVGVIDPKPGARISHAYPVLHLATSRCRATICARTDHSPSYPRLGDASAIMRISAMERA